MGKDGFRFQPMKVGAPKFATDMVMVIKTNTTTGQTIIESGNGVPLNPLNVISVCLSVATANLGAYMKQASGIVGNGIQLTDKHERSADNPPHNFVACDDNPVICSYCGSHKDNHTVDNGSN